MDAENCVHSTDCVTCTHEKDDSGYCLECYNGSKWEQKKGTMEEEKQK